MENTRTIMPSVLAKWPLFKVQSSIMASLLLFLEQAAGEYEELLVVRHYLVNFDSLITLAWMDSTRANSFALVTCGR